MKTALSFIAALSLIVALVLPVSAEEVTGEKVTLLKLDSGASVGPGGRAAGQDEQLVLREADFAKYAQSKVQEMNRNHILSRSRMRIDKSAGGLYRAMYHEIDDNSLSYQVRRSSSKSNPFVAVLSYQERVFSASCATPADCRRADFTPVEVIPNRHIFTYGKGGWQ